ncbi:M36 family metallopeptidase [Nocardioides speluncae]|uniref:M36 family metallopeptidase n=1 Tax=Nocardioides speluncae TaxID=2670337 RepID=UPI000D690314|nr:M36 family metallopeptidase [Nocardioides speluncae]
MAIISTLRSRIRPSQAIAAGLAAALVVSMPSAGGQPAPAGPAPDSKPVVTLGDSPAGLADLDARGRALPTASRRAAVGVLGADVRWNAFGTPASILPRDGSLGSAGASPVAAARAWLRSHRVVFGLTSGQVDRLELVNSQAFTQSSARAVLFRQRFGSLSAALGGQVTVGVAGGKVAYVSSSVVPSAQQAPAAELTPVEGWLAAARNVGRAVAADDVDLFARATSALGWNRLKVPGFAQDQLVRLRALPLADGRVRPVFEANVVDTEGGSAFAYTLMVDAVTGKVLHRQNQVEHSSDFVPFNGTMTATACGPKHPFALTDDNTRTIQVTASAVIPTNDIVVKLWSPDGQLLASQDTGTSPEPLLYTSDQLPEGVYSAQVCPFDAPTVPFLEPGAYAGTVATSDAGAPEPPSVPLPRWRFFPANPTLNWSAGHTPRNSVIGCWATRCSLPSGPLEQPWGSPWDTLPHAHLPSFTTVGNNAVTHEAWVSPLTPGGLFQAPVSPTREYTEAFTDQWNNKRCDPTTTLVPGGNDINAVTGNLFVSHNRMHDYAYGLGFTERNYNLQADNLGRNPDPTRAGDPEIGNVQAGAIGGLQSGLGRDNANQITLQDGVPGITNQYLFQPIAGAFYSPCADGSLDMSIVGHEYTHAITNRMVGGPDEGLTSEHGGAMGESWGDLVGAEYLVSHGYSTGTNPWAVGPYATGNKTRGIRDYAINANPLNFSDYGFDSTGDEVHADGEIWNGTMWDVRQALVRKWNARYPATNRSLQLACAQGSATRSPLPASRCPGNRRWVQLMFDSFLLQQGATSMLDARDALLAADRMRFGGANQTVLWNAFAKRGMGSDARTPNADSGAVTAGFASPKASNARVAFKAGVGGRVYVGHYEARVSPVADTVRGTRLDNVVRLTPGRYQLLFQARGHGFKRFTVTVKPGERRTVAISAPRNLASKTAGAKVIAASPGSINTASLIDDTEATNWAGINDGTNVDARHPFVTVDLAGGVHTVKRVQVSAMLRPAPASPTDLPLAADPDSGSRFTALRRFALEACVSSCASPGARWKRFYTSSANAFPAVKPRPVAPNLILRGFDVPDVRAAAIRLVALENQCTGYSGYAGDQDDDPLNDTDCKSASDRGQSVRAAELQVY